MQTINTWAELLKQEGIPGNAVLNFHCHNEGVRRVVYSGGQVPFSKESREYAREWLFSNRQESFIVNGARLDGYDWKRFVVIKVSFLNGEPTGHPSFGNRNERKTVLQAIWGKT